MTDQKRRATLRMLFLLVCVLPTGIVLISLFGSGLLASTTAAFSGNRRANDSDSVDLAGLPRNIANYSKTETTKWLGEIGVRSASTHLSKTIAASISTPLSFDDLSENHPLRLLSLSELRVMRSDQTTKFSAADCVLSRSELLDFAKSFYSGQWAPILKDKVVAIEFENVTLTDQSDVSSGAIFLCDVKLKFDSENPSLVSITGRQKDSLAIQSIEKPFRGSFSKSDTDFSFTCTTYRFPIWVFGNAIAKLAGAAATFRGSYQYDSNGIGEEFSSAFVGEFNRVSAATISSGAVVGSADVTAKTCRFENGRLNEFDGKVMSSTSGMVNKEILQQASEQFVMTGKNAVELYLSFGCHIELTNNQLKVKAFKGNGSQIIWGSMQNTVASTPNLSVNQTWFEDQLQVAKSFTTFPIVEVSSTGSVVIDVKNYLDRFFLED